MLLTIIKTKAMVMSRFAIATTLCPAAIASAIEVAVYDTIIRVNIIIKKASTVGFKP